MDAFSDAKQYATINASVEMSSQVFNVKESKEVVDITEVLSNLSQVF